MITIRRLAVVATVLLGGLTSSCHTGGDGSFFGRRGQRAVSVHIENNNFLNVTIYVRASGNALRLGDVGGKDSATFTVDPRNLPVLNGLQLRVEPLGSNRNYLSPEVFPARGSTVFLYVAAELDQSYVTVR